VQSSLNRVQRLSRPVVATGVEAALGASPLTRPFAPAAGAVVRHPAAAKQAVARTVGNAAGAVRATARGLEDGATDNRANEFYAKTGARLGLGEGETFEERRADLLAREAALDSRDRQAHPNARQFGRDIPATIEFLNRASMAARGDLRPSNLKAMDNLLTNRPIEHPEGWEAAIPLWGSGKEAVADYQDGDHGGAAINAGLAASDIFLVKAAATAPAKVVTKKAFFKQPKEGLLQPYKWDGRNGVREWMGKTGQLKNNQVGHHWLFANLKKPGELTKQEQLYQRLFNQPWNIKPVDWLTHQRLHGQMGQKQMNILSRLWAGTPQWAKMAVSQATLRPMQRAENAGESRE
jgi:hypothetical protein